MPSQEFIERFGRPPGSAKTPLTAAEKEARGQTLLYSLGAAVTLAGVVLLLGMMFQLGWGLLTFSFALGLAVVNLILVTRSGPSSIILPLTAAAGAIGGYAAVGAAVDGEVPALVGAVLGTAILVIVAYVARRGNIPALLVVVAGFLLVGHLVSYGTYSLILLGPILLLATMRRPWPTYALAIAFVAGFTLLTHSAERPNWVLYVHVGLTLAAAVVLVSVVRAVPAPRQQGAGPRSNPMLTDAERGVQPWHLLSLIFFFSWLGVQIVPDTERWVALVVAGAAALAGVALPEPEGSVRAARMQPQQLLLSLGVCMLAFSLAIGWVEPVVEHHVLIGLAILLQIRPFVQPGLGWVVRGVPAFLAFFATIESSVGIWAEPEIFLADWHHLVNVGLLTLLGVAMMVFRHSRPNPILDGIRFVLGLYLAGYALVAGAALLGHQLGDITLGFLLGHALASVMWMAFACWIALRRGSRTPAADLTVAGVIAVAATGKLVLFDMQMLGGISRVAAFLLCGSMMLFIAHQRQRRSRTPQPPPAAWGQQRYPEQSQQPPREGAPPWH